MEHRVLVVDDDQVVGQSFERVLGGKGYRVDTAMNGKEAFEKYADGRFDMVFTDLRMPGQDGLEVAKRIKEMNPWLPVVVVTGYGTEEAETRARAIGVEEFLHKPLTPALIEEVAARVMEHRATAAEPEVVAAPEIAAAPTVAAAPAKVNVARNIALFFAAPFIGLAYMIAFPFVGFGMLIRWGFRAATGKKA